MQIPKKHRKRRIPRLLKPWYNRFKAFCLKYLKREKNAAHVPYHHNAPKPKTNYDPALEIERVAEFLTTPSNLSDYGSGMINHRLRFSRIMV